jgi:hypothetical protein
VSALCRSILSLWIATTCVTALPAWGADTAGGLVKALEKKYAITGTSFDHQQITKDGTTMSMQRAGVFAFPVLPLPVGDNHVADGVVHGPSPFFQGNSHVLQTGDQVYILKIDVTSKKQDEIRFVVLTVNSFDIPAQQTQGKYYANVVFQFKKGYLDDAPPQEVEQAIEAVLAPESGSSNNAGGSGGGGQAPPVQSQQRAQPAPPAPAAQAAPASPPPTISIGESTTDVLLAMGKPTQRMDLGKKQIYIYPGMKITFVDDKVSDMQPQ